MTSTTIPFHQRAEAFGLHDPATSPVLPLLPLLFDTPRLFRPLAEAWDARRPGALQVVRRLTNQGWLAHQPAVVIDTRTGDPAAYPTRPSPRYVTTAKGQRLLADADADWRLFEAAFPKTSVANLPAVHRLLSLCDLSGGDRPFGLSCPHASDRAGLPDRTGRWWFVQLTNAGYLRRLPFKLADVREVVPAHWRPTRPFAAQLAEVCREVDAAPDHLIASLRLRRSRFLDDIDPARVGIGGATDYDHDVTTQRILAAMLRSPSLEVDSVFAVEPRLLLPMHTDGAWRLDFGGDDVKIYQPDAEVRERLPDGRIARSVLEYERFQSRRDGWNHISQFVGWAHTTTPAQPAVLRFVVDSPGRARAYVELVEAYADWCLDHPETVPASDVTLAVGIVDRLEAAADPLHDDHWARITLPAGDGECTGVPLHPRDDTPYDDYFSTGGW